MFFTYGYLFYIPVNLVYVTIILAYGIKKAKPYPYYIFSIIASIYVNNVIDIVYFPILAVRDEEWTTIRPFIDFSLDFAHMGGLRQIGGNILLTLPMGILLPCMFDLSKKIRWISTIILSGMVELVQLWAIAVFHSVTKFFDVKDIILNVTGGLVGLIAFEVLKAIMNKAGDTKIKNTFFKYIYLQCNVGGDSQDGTM